MRCKRRTGGTLVVAASDQRSNRDGAAWGWPSGLSLAVGRNQKSHGAPSPPTAAAAGELVLRPNAARMWTVPAQTLDLPASWKAPTETKPPPSSAHAGPAGWAHCGAVRRCSHQRPFGARHAPGSRLLRRHTPGRRARQTAQGSQRAQGEAAAVAVGTGRAEVRPPRCREVTRKTTKGGSMVTRRSQAAAQAEEGVEEAGEAGGAGAAGGLAVRMGCAASPQTYPQRPINGAHTSRQHQ